MGTFGIWHWLILGAVALVLFGGRGKVSDLMGDVAKGIKAFRQGMNEPDDPKVIPGSPSNPTPTPNKDQTTVGR